MKKFLVSSLVIVSFGLYALLYRPQKSLPQDQAIVSAESQIASTPQQVTPSHGTASTSPTLPSTPNAAAATSARYKDGRFVGNSVDAFYGNVQVAVTVKGGKISDVSFIDHPKDRSTSVEINNQAMPLLRQEVIKAQSAQIDGVSGATATSNAFVQSLQSALSQA